VLKDVISGAIVVLARANAGLKAAKSISELTKSMDNLVAIFIQIIPYLYSFARIKGFIPNSRVRFFKVSSVKGSSLAEVIPLLHFRDVK
jgi:hypothetical protein